jgi:hypothetical protein
VEHVRCGALNRFASNWRQIVVFYLNDLAFRLGFDDRSRVLTSVWIRNAAIAAKISHHIAMVKMAGLGQRHVEMDSILRSDLMCLEVKDLDL